ncbi:thiol:disulfide interchange protein/DsbC/DsbD-like thiol-disulfide interchange protein [Amorphus suaedae]
MLALAILAQPAAAAGASIDTDHIATRIVVGSSSVAPGDTVEIAITQTVEDGWHTYWENPGDSGAPTLFGWALPSGPADATIQWPTPERLPYPPLVNFGYSGKTTYLATLTVPADWPAGDPLPVDLTIDWLVCADICIPESGSATFEIPTGTTSELDSAVGFTFVQARREMPAPVTWPAKLSGMPDGHLTLEVEPTGVDLAKLSQAFYFPLDPDLIDNAAEQTFDVQGQTLALALRPHGPTPPAPVDGLLVLTDTSGQRKGYALTADGPEREIPAPVAASAGAAQSGPGGGTPAASETASTTATAIPAPTGTGFLRAVVFALIGGLILNLMPCVFPVLALKAVAFAGHGHASARDRIGQGAAYTAGILVSFLLLAGTLIALKAGGMAVGWGFQLQQPLVVAVLVYVLVLIGLNLSGLYEIGLGLTRAGGLVHGSSGVGGSFLTGVLAAVVATPCTAPFMAVAIGYALTQGTGVTLAVFTALGLGLALPFLLISLVPAIGRLLPKPGMWMVRLRQVLAFPLYATAAWLIWVLTQQAGVDAMFAVLVGCVLLAFAAWMTGLRQGGMQRGRWAAALAAVVGLVGAVALLSPSLADGPSQGAIISASADDYGAEPFTPARLDALRADGKPVFLNITAAWCITCKVNEKVAFRSGFREALVRDGVTYMTADWTRRDPAITAYLERYGRAGVPLYLVFPEGDGPAAVLPQILTEDIVVRALDAAAGRSG